MPKVKKSNKPEANEALEASFKISDNTKLQINVFKRIEGDDEDATVYVNFRKFYRTKKDPSWKPARQGMTMPMELAKKLRIKLKNVCEAAEEDADSIPELKANGRGDD